MPADIGNITSSMGKTAWHRIAGIDI
jgi:hypothetical protein